MVASGSGCRYLVSAELDEYCPSATGSVMYNGKIIGGIAQERLMSINWDSMRADA